MTVFFTHLKATTDSGTPKLNPHIEKKATDSAKAFDKSLVNSVRWLSVQVTIDSVKYTGFCCGTFLKEQ